MQKKSPPLNQKQDKILGGLFGLLIGDALGVPYEFYPPEQLPAYQDIEMQPPAGFKRTHSRVEAGTWSDDGAQALCLLDSLLCCGSFSLDDFSNRLLSWYEHGLWAVENVVFDVGIQTSSALRAYKNGYSPEICGKIRPEGKGNGALMRVLPLALWHDDKEKLVLDAHEQCLITHGHLCNQVCCALYCLVANALFEGENPKEAIQTGVDTLRQIYRNMPEYAKELEWSIRPDGPWEGTGSGYVVDSLRSAFMLLEQTKSYEESVKRAVYLGNDTDTTACITGGLTGIFYGFSSIPERWISMLKERNRAEELFQKLLCRRNMQPTLSI